MARTLPLLLLLLLSLSLPGGAGAATIHLEAGDFWCERLNEAGPGDEVILGGGGHAGPCWITAGGTAEAPLVVRGETNSEGGLLTRIAYDGGDSNVIDVEADHLVIRDLVFDGSRPGVDAIKIRSGDGLTVEGCLFAGIGGISIAATSGDTDGLTIRRNELMNLDATAIYLGSHDGGVVASDYLVEGNLIHGVDSEGVGYGVQAKVGSWGTVRDNVIADTKGPGLMVYGAWDDTLWNRIEGNLVVGSREAASLEVGGGPARLRSNIVVGGAVAALWIYDYGDRGLVRSMLISGNTVVGETGPGALLHDFAPDRSLEFTNNAVGHLAGGDGLPEPPDGTAWAGNVDCGPGCWWEPEIWDFWPAWTSDLLAAADTSFWVPEQRDFCGLFRSTTSGALEAESDSWGPLVVDFKDRQACLYDDEPEWDDDDMGGRFCGTGSGGCHCSATGPSPVGLLLLLVGASLIRASGRRTRPSSAPAASP